MVHFFSRSNGDGPLRGRSFRSWSVLRVLVLVAIVSILLATGFTVSGIAMPLQATRPQAHAHARSFHQIHAKIEKDLCHEKRDLVDWAAELLEKEPKDAEEAMIKIEILCRTGLSDHAVKMVPSLQSFFPDSKRSEATQNIRGLVQMSYNEFQEFPTAIALIETYPEQMNLSLRGCFPLLKKHFHKEGWDKTQIDQWLAKLQKQACKNRTLFISNRSAQPWYIQHDQRLGTVWLVLRFQNCQQRDEKIEFLEALEEEAKQAPEDILKMIDLMYLCQMVPWGGQAERPDLSWIAEKAQPKKSLEAFFLGQGVMRNQQWKPAKKLFQKAEALLEKPKNTSTEDPDRRLFMAGGRNRSYKQYLQQMIKQCDSHLKREAPPFQQGQISATTTTAVTALLDPSDTPQITPEPPVTVVVELGENDILAKKKKDFAKREKLLLAKEEKSKNDPSYWLCRVSLYANLPYKKMTKEEREKLEAAFKKGLKLTDPNVEKNRRYNQVRISLFQKYLSFLRQAERHEEGFQLLLKELEHAPAKSDLAKSAIQRLSAHYYLEFLKPDEPILWKWLEKKPKWSYLENQLLNLMARKAKESVDAFSVSFDSEASGTIYAFVERIEKLAKEGDPSRMEFCIRVLQGSSSLGIEACPKRLAPLLKAKLAQKDLNKSYRQKFTHSLFQIYIKDKQIDEAEKLFDDPALQIRSRHLYTSLATAAAKQSDKAMAMRNWRRSANCALKDQRQIRLNQTFRRHGLGGQIDTYYEEVKKKLPDFVIPK